MKDSTSHRIFVLTGTALAVLFLTAHPGPLAGAAAATATDTAQPAPPPAPSASDVKKQAPEKILKTCPLYPGTVFVTSIENDAMVRAIFGVGGDLKTVMDWYKKALTDREWNLLHEKIKGNEARLVLRKGEEQLGFSAQQQKNDYVTYFLSIIKK